MTDKITLVRPTVELKEQALDYKKEHFDFGETVIDGSELLDRMDCYEDWLRRVTHNAQADTAVPDQVLTDTFFAVRESDKRIVGIIDFRHRLNDFLKDFGHCGYSVRPSERNQGYASEMLSQVCVMAKAQGLDVLQLSVERDNFPSIRTIVKNGGVYERSFAFGDALADVYLIQLSSDSH